MTRLTSRALVQQNIINVNFMEIRPQRLLKSLVWKCRTN